MSLEGIYAKLARVAELAKEIERLSAEVLTTADPVLVESPTAEDADDMLQRVARLAVPLRLSVLTGEGLYHLRSSLDHLVCDLIREDKSKPGRSAQFPIFREEPVSSKELKTYNRYVEGIVRSEVLHAIRDWQPYRGVRPDGTNTRPFLMLQSLNNFDKHNALHLNTTVVERKVRAKAQIGNFTLEVDAVDSDNDTRIDRELLPFGTEVPADVSKVRRIEAAIVIDHSVALNRRPGELLEHLRWRVGLVVSDMKRFIE